MFGLGIYRKKDIELYKETSDIDAVIISKLQEELLQLKDYQQVMKQIEGFKRLDDETIIDIGNNKGDIYVLTKRVTRNSLNIKMKDPFTKVYPEVFATLLKDYNSHEAENNSSPNKVVFIEDINAVYKRRGNGKILMNAVIAFAKEHGYEQIKGRLTEGDKIATPGLPIFYEKLGFELNKEQTNFVMNLYY